jgi:hypothetical protein
MQSLEYGTGFQYINVWPDTTSSLAGNVSASFSLDYVQDYDKSSGSLDLTLQNTPNRVDPRLQFRLDRSTLPIYTGNYTITIKEGLVDRRTWSLTNLLWTGANFKWSDTDPVSITTTLDTDRAWISGSNVPSFKQYESPNEIGQYTTYNG